MFTYFNELDILQLQPFGSNHQLKNNIAGLPITDSICSLKPLVHLYVSVNVKINEIENFGMQWSCGLLLHSPWNNVKGSPRQKKKSFAKIWEALKNKETGISCPCSWSCASRMIQWQSLWGFLWETDASYEGNKTGASGMCFGGGLFCTQRLLTHSIIGISM